VTSTGPAPYRRLSLWLDAVDDDLSPRPGLAGDREVDVAIVGAGYTGLWTAYALMRHDPGLRVVLLEREIAGFGASGRNGGWCSDLFPVSWDRVVREQGADAQRRMHRALVDGIDDVAATAAREHIEADIVKGGCVTLAMTPLQETELRAEVIASQQREDADLALRWLDREEAAARVRIAGCRGAHFTPNCARLHPGKLVRGLAGAVERAGAEILERTEVLELQPHAAVTSRGTVRAQTVVRATEAFTAHFRADHRALLPLYSLMIATAPLPEEVWADIGWSRGETLNDGRHLIIYGQRTADNRIAFGGRGAPYHFGSRVIDSFDSNPSVFNALKNALHDLIPQTRGIPITHRWGGPIGIARDWYPSVTIDRDRGLATAGGYVGDGVTASNVAGRTVADLILSRDTDLTRLPWVQHRSRRWESEPLRWLAVNFSVQAMRSADAVEHRTGRRSLQSRLVTRLQGR
jgi:glycine/D-amino acid oxidase-like deaminating enzyme